MLTRKERFAIARATVELPVVKAANTLSMEKLNPKHLLWLIGSIDTRWQIARRRIESGMLTEEQFHNQIASERYVVMRLPKWFQRLALRGVVEAVKAANERVTA